MRYGSNEEAVCRELNDAPFHRIITWMSHNPTEIEKRTDIIEERLYNGILCKTLEDEEKNPKRFISLKSINSFFMILTSGKSITNKYYEMMNLMANRVVLPAILTSDVGNYGTIYASYKMLITLLFDIDAMRKCAINGWGSDREDIEKGIYLKIMNLYIPSNDPETIIDGMMKLDMTECLRNSGDTAWFISKHDLIFPNIPLKESLLIFKILSDIYMNREASIEFFRLYHAYTHTIAYITESANNIGDRYKKYLAPEERIPFVMHIMQTLDESTALYANECYSFCQEYPEYQKTIPQNVMRCLVGDCADKLKSNHFMKHSGYMGQASEALIMQWGERGIEKEEHALTPAIEAVKKDSIAMNEAQKKIYKAYKTYKNAEEKVDSQITKAVMGIKGVLTGDVRTEIIEGKKFSAISLLKRLLGTVALFSWNPIKAAIAMVVRYALKKKTTESEKKKIIMEIETEIEMLEEKINDARGDQNREAKYSMMRTKKELENAKKRIQYGMEASQKDLDNAHQALNEARR